MRPRKARTPLLGTWFALVAAGSGGCSDASPETPSAGIADDDVGAGSDDDATAVPDDDSTPEECDVEAEALHVAGPDAVDCGWIGYGEPDGALIDCVIDAHTAGRAFWGGVDEECIEACSVMWAGNAGGAVWSFEVDWMPGGSPDDRPRADRRECFGLHEVPPSRWTAEPRSLDCDGWSARVRVCE